MLTSKYSRISIFLHILLFLTVASSALTYWKAADYAIHGHWLPEYYKDQSYIAIVPSWQKLVKDGLAFLLLLGSLFWPATNPVYKYQKNNNIKVAYILLLFVISISLARSILTNFSLSILFFTTRPLIITAAIFIFCHRHLNNHYLIKVLEFTNILAISQVFYAVMQRMTAVNYNSVSWFSSGIVRSVGTFTEPNSLGLFLVICAYFNIYILKWHPWRIALLAAYALAIFLSDSRTSILILFLLFTEKIFYHLTRFCKTQIDFLFLNFTRFAILPFLAFYAILAVKDLSIRGANSSLYGGRLEIFLAYVNQSDIFSVLFGKHLGFGSNTLKILQDSNILEGSDAALADSTWSYILFQFGILGILLVIQILYLLFKDPIIHLNLQKDFQVHRILVSQKMAIGIYLFCCLATIIIFEFYAVLPLLVCSLFFIQYQYYYYILFVQQQADRN
ncbi:MAG TPA: hypothetical protein DDZ80_23725 [Cyanobacteria bacterium UBA8803]|nr:hypothetical protein [Cyanobacteria bacterium UBA9273]HBL61330.1 hypothetical protein [Cyanobacteria bacterium UBA8803]